MIGVVLLPKDALVATLSKLQRIRFYNPEKMKSSHADEMNV